MADVRRVKARLVKRFGKCHVQEGDFWTLAGLMDSASWRNREGRELLPQAMESLESDGLVEKTRQDGVEGYAITAKGEQTMSPALSDRQISVISWSIILAVAAILVALHLWERSGRGKRHHGSRTPATQSAAVPAGGAGVCGAYLPGVPRRGER